MKKILITGKDSYIGTSFENWLQQWPEAYQVDTVDMVGDAWRAKDFSGYDAVFHVAGIAHADTGHADAATQKKYYAINTDLTIETARKAKHEGVKQFVFMSSIIVYGASSNLGETKVITKDTIPQPENFYGDSKLKAEEGILSLQSEGFHVAILRPPMIYGKGSKGNYPKLAKLAKTSPIFPDIDNQRSMLYIDNLCEFIRLVIDHNNKGIFFPQNKAYVCTKELVQAIAKAHGKTIHLTKLFNPMIKAMAKRNALIGKVFGSLVYDKDLSKMDTMNYQTATLEESVRKTEG